jgi:hypothetical protein
VFQRHFSYIGTVRREAMTKKKLSVLVLAVLTVGLLSLAFAPILPVSAANQPAHDVQTAVVSVAPSQPPAVLAARIAQPLAAAAGAVVFVLFGILAVSPLLLGNSAQALEEANRHRG